MLKYAATPPRQGMGFCPTMALLGGLDPLADSRAMAQVGALLPDAETHTLRLAGHFPMETHSRALRDYLRGWLRFNDGE
jgi:pimeloyl-ACP methyl ester carboxylesterase